MCAQPVQGSGLHSQQCKKGGDWKGRRKEGSGTLSTVSFRPAWATPYLKQCIKEGLATSSGGPETKGSDLPSGTQEHS